MHDIWSQLRQWVIEKRSFALATVVEASKPSPRGIGAVLAICEGGQDFIGSVSAGCVENEVIDLAQSCIRDAKTRWIKFGPDQGMPWEVSLSCGGKISVRIDPFTYDKSITPKLCEALDNHVFGLWITQNDRQFLLNADGELTGDASLWSPQALDLAKEHLKAKSETQQIETPDGTPLFRSLEKPKRLFIVGAVHIAIHLVAIARTLNYQTIVIDPREHYTNSDRFATKPEQLITAWPSQALIDFTLSSTDCTIAITHDRKIDDDALSVFLKSGSAYIGALGSNKSHQARLNRLSELGFSEQSISKIHGPIGLDIGSKTPAEIAISIMAEIVQKTNAR
ncbi:XdhC family protein [Puniceicoccaceae bacterium K14]|nr:XdhC family protein [Puniceicoccaceae bacterium K14]